MSGPDATQSEWHNFLTGQGSPGDRCPSPSASLSVSSQSVSTPVGAEEVCSRPQDEQRERRPMQGQAGRASTRSSMSDGSSTMRQSGCFRHRVRFSDEGREPYTPEDDDESDMLSTEQSLTASLFLGSASRGVHIPRLDTSKVIPTIMLNSTAGPRQIKVLSAPLPRSAPPPISTRVQQPRTTPRSNSASTFGSTSGSTAQPARQAATSVTPRSVLITPRQLLSNPSTAASKSARSSTVKPPHAAPPVVGAHGSMSARRSSSGTRSAALPLAPATAPLASSTAPLAAAPAPAVVTSSRGFNAMGSTSNSSARITPRSSANPLSKPLSKASGASTLSVPTVSARACPPALPPTSKQSTIPVPVSRPGSGRRSSTVAGGGALVSAPSKLPWSSTIGVRPPSHAASSMSSRLGESSVVDRRNRQPAAALDFVFTTSAQTSSGPTTPAKVGSMPGCSRDAAAAATQLSLPRPMSRLHQSFDEASSELAEDEGNEQLTPRTATPQPEWSDCTGSSPCTADINSVTLEVQRNESSDVWASDNRSEGKAPRSPKKAAVTNALTDVMASPVKADSAAAQQQRSTPTNSISAVQASRTAIASSTAVIAGTAAAWSPEKVKPGSSVPARFVPASLQLHDEDLAQRVAAAAVSKALVLELVKMAVESVEGAKMKAAEEESAAAAAAEASRKAAGRGGIQKGGLVIIGKSTTEHDDDKRADVPWCGCSIM